MLPTSIYLPDQVFTGAEWLNNHAVTVAGSRIVSVEPYHESGDITTEQLPGTLAPAFLDLQIYGAYGKLFSAYPEPDSLRLLNAYCNKGGAIGCLPTVATNTKEVVWRCIDAVRGYWQQGGEGVLGLHLEGPWINPVKRGAHIEELVHTPTEEEVKELLAYGEGVIRIITLAPERIDSAVLQLLKEKNIIISAGHSNATYDQAISGFEDGITAVTHLYNAMSPLQHREPGLAGAAMDHSHVMASIIPDGIHVDYAALRVAKAAMKERLFAITDAVTETPVGPYPHQPGEDRYVAGGILSGSALDMAKALRNLVQYGKIDTGEALRMCSLYPAMLAGLDHELGRIGKGYRSAMVLLDSNLEVTRLIKD